MVLLRELPSRKSPNRLPTYRGPMTGSQSRTSENGTSRVVAGMPSRVYSGSYWSTLVGSSTLSAPPSTPRAPPPKRRQRVAAACCWCERNLIATGPLTSPESWPLGAKTVRESSDSFDPPKGSFQYNPSSRQCVTWSDSRSRIAIVAVGNLFGFDLNYENSRFLVFCRVSWVQTESRERHA